ncbi:unnamed protein product, partial [Polarella glacialis]
MTSAAPVGLPFISTVQPCEKPGAGSRPGSASGTRPGSSAAKRQNSMTRLPDEVSVREKSRPSVISVGAEAPSPKGTPNAGSTPKSNFGSSFSGLDSFDRPSSSSSTTRRQGGILRLSDEACAPRSAELVGLGSSSRSASRSGSRPGSAAQNLNPSPSTGMVR